MSLQQLLILAISSMAILAVSRVVRVHFGRTAHLEGRGRRLFVIGLLFVPPIVLEALIQPVAGTGQLRGIGWVPLYTALLVGVAILMGLVALVVRFVGPVRARPVVLLALVGREADPYDVPFDPPMTASLAESVALVDSTNAAFPRGVDFPTQIDRTGFREDWDALEGATRTLEGRIASDFRLGLAVASGAMATAADARSRLDTLQRFAVDKGQVWAG
jgi:hypothetical protein